MNDVRIVEKIVKLKKVKSVKTMRQPGFEPGSTAWKATILTTGLLTLIHKS